MIATFLCGAGCGDTGSWGEDGSFSWQINALSDLGVSKVANIFNYSLILAGILNIVFGIGLLKAYGGTKISYLSIILLIIGGLFLSLIGLSTEAYGSLHFFVSAGFFIFAPLSIILIGISFISSNKIRSGYFSITTGALALIMISSYFTGIYSTLGYGLSVPEYISSGIISIWISWMGLNLFFNKPKK
ncbi:DUF998 domain-containing protein [Thermoproteota archaeon]